MTLSVDNRPPLAQLIAALDRAVEQPTDRCRCQAVKAALQEVAGSPGALPQRCAMPAADGYARRLLHRDLAGRYTIVAMTWATGQGTPIHNHDGLWCVECVYAGRIRVASYLRAERPDGRLDFAAQQEFTAGVGAAGALIPPLDEHVIQNPFAEPAVTVHVYGGDMQRCAVFMPAEDGGYVECQKVLHYTE